jgi:transglutaminase-like putative cysteine protease
MRIRAFILSLAILLAILSLPKLTLAAGEFDASYDVNYDVQPNGETIVTEDVLLKNLTDKYYASSFSLIISASQIYDLAAFDAGGPLEVSQEMDFDKSQLEQSRNKTKLMVKFNQQLAGKGKEYKWTLKYKSKDFAQLQGSVYQVSIPKIIKTPELDRYNLSLSMPVNLGDPTTIIPEPASQSETNGKINFYFTKEQLLQSGILANFGSEQLFNFKLGYNLANKNILPSLVAIPLPPDTPYQQVTIDSIAPTPINVERDIDGNYLAYFKLDKLQSLQVKVSGLAKVFVDPQFDKEEYQIKPEMKSILLTPQRFWESDNPAIKQKLKEILPGEPLSVSKKARLIDNFVSSSLHYNQKRVESDDFERLGSYTALSNPDKALCQEFADLFIALARAAGIPARLVVGYAYSGNNELRPLSFQKNILHAWPEYYDPEQNGWVMIDPTWENTTGGVDYFSKFDLNHLVLAIRGYSSTTPTPASEVAVDFDKGEFVRLPKARATLNSPKEIYAGFPAGLSLRIENWGNSVLPADSFAISSSRTKLIFSPEGKVARSFQINTPAIPPFGHLDYSFGFGVDSYIANYDEKINFQFVDQQITKELDIKPFFTNKLLPWGVMALLLLMVSFYLGSVILFFKRHKVFFKVLEDNSSESKH